ncbi:MAG: hypothetical protein AB7P02_20520 [Alphaproteobacteria bacterium]
MSLVDEAPTDTAEVAAAERHLLARVGAAPVAEAPFPHLFVEEAFPAAFYRRLLAELPAPADLPTLRSTGRVGPMYSPERRVLELRPEAIGRLPGPRAAFWSAFARSLRGWPLFAALGRRFAPQLAARFPGGLDGITIDALYCDDAARYALEPHTDAPRKVLTALFYLPEAPGQEHLGTALYEPVDAGFRSAGEWHQPRDRFRLARTMPYRPNAMFAFAKSDRSFHGVEPVADADLFRRVLIVNVSDAGSARQ